MSAGKGSTKTYQKYDFLKNVRPNLSLVVLIEVVLIKEKACKFSTLEDPYIVSNFAT